MSDHSSHPTPEELSAYSLGQLPPERAVAIDSQISECRPCCDTIVGLSSDDTFVGLLREARQLPTEQAVDHGAATASSSVQGVPVPLAEHPRYEIVGLIGKGGMGDVYKARHRKMERTVALKVINRGLVRKSEAIDRFHREVKAAAQLSHPNIVTAYDADQASEFHFMIMEYVDGVDLSQTVKDRGALPVAETCEYIRQAAIGLQHAHERGMVHRDIKPHNLMVTQDGIIKILDFGLASLAPGAVLDGETVEARGDLTAAGAIMGTPDFISPEQAEDARQADIRSDIYSLGTTLYFLLSGQAPFADGSVMHKLKSHAHAEPVPLESLRNDLPPELTAVVARMTAKDPSERFQTPAEVVEALETLVKETEPTKSREPVLEVQPRRRRIGWIPLTAIATIFLAVIFAGIVYYIETNNGIVRVEVVDDSLAVEISGQTITVGDGNKEPLEIRAGDCVLKVRQGDFEFETDRFQILRGDEVAFKVEMLEGEIVVRKDGERFHSKALSDDIEVRQILDRMEKAYAECKSYRDSGAIKSVFLRNNGSLGWTVEHSFTTAFVRPDRFRFEIKTEDNRLLISATGKNVQTWWDVEPGIQEPGSLELAMAKAVGFSGGYVGRIPAMLMPQRLKLSCSLDLIDPNQIEDGKLQDVECFRLEYNFRDEQFTLWIDKQSCLVRRIEERIKVDNIRIERTTTYDPTIDGKITDEMLAFDPPSQRAADDGANTLPESNLGSNDSPTRTAQEQDSDADTHQAGQQRSDNQFDMPLCWCPAGEFKMGREQLPVTLTRGFWMGKYEVTQAQYEALMGENPSENKGESPPVEKVAWNEAGKFCQKFTELERKAGRLPRGWEYRLPTEAQWEYACRAGTTLVWDDEKALVYPSTFGDDLSELGDYAWYSANSDGTPHQVGRKKPNAWGLCDMYGNVREWVRDAWQSKLSGGMDPEVDLGSPIHARRGGDWLAYAEPCGSPFIRGFGGAGLEVHMMGFRVALVPVGDSGDAAAAGGDLGLLQGDWEAMSVTEGGKQLTAEEGLGSLLLQIKDRTFSMTETKPDGAKSEPTIGLIEINMTKSPRTIDFIERDQSDKRSIGIYELKEGVLRICMAETGGNDSPPGERIPEVKPTKRPTTFDSPNGSNILLAELRRKQPDVNSGHEVRNLLDTTYISNDAVGLLVAHPQRILSRKSKVKEELDQMFAEVADKESLEVRNLNQIVVQLGPPPLSRRPIENFFDEEIWTLILRFDEPVDVESYIEKHAQGYEKAEHKHATYYRHGSRMEMWFPDNRTLILAAERRILSLIEDPEGKGPMAMQMRRADATDDLLIEIDVRQAGPLLLESLPSEAQAPEVYPVIKQTIEKLNRISLTVKQTADTPIRARFEAIDAEKANQLHALASFWFETAKGGWPKLREMIRERPVDKDTKLANAVAEEIDTLLPSTWLAIDEDQLLVRVEKEDGVDLAALLVFFLLID